MSQPHQLQPGANSQPTSAAMIAASRRSADVPGMGSTPMEVNISFNTREPWAKHAKFLANAANLRFPTAWRFSFALLQWAAEDWKEMEAIPDYSHPNALKFA
jgi:hypothetical protein